MRAGAWLGFRNIWPNEGETHAEEVSQTVDAEVIALASRESTNILAGGAKRAHHRKVEVLVGEKAQGGALPRVGKYDDLVRDRIGRVAQCCLDVVMRQPRVRIEKVRFRRPLR